ncbi:histidine kinase, partial [candidate division KSB1 bacterium]|nr:histidine kinase [candidate division KSB1 bacterium]
MYYYLIQKKLFSTRMMRFISLFLFIVIAILCSEPADAQEQGLKFSKLTIEDGLSHSKVNCIFQDKQGFLWFGTNLGLDKYDGYKFTVFQQNPENPASLSANLIRCIREDSKGNFWVGTEAGGLNRFHRDFNTFQHYTTDSSSEIILSGNDVNSILEDHAGKLWLATNHGIDLLDLDKKRVINFLPYPPGSNPQYSNEIQVIYEDSHRNFWVGTLGGGLCLFDREKKTFKKYYRHDAKNPTSLDNDEIRSIYEDSQHNLWIGTTLGALHLYNYETEQFIKFHPAPRNPESTTIRAILDDGRGNLWIGNRAGLFRFNRKSHRFEHYFHNPDDPYSLVQNSILDIFIDRKGDLWIASRGGISFLNTTNLPFFHYWAENNNRARLNRRSVFAILEDSQGDLWFGTENGGLNYLKRETQLFTYYQHQPNNPNSLNVNNIKTLLEDQDGNLWIGTFSGGLNFYDRKKEKFIHYVHEERNPNSLSNNNIMACIEDDEGKIWIGTLGGGLDCFDKKHRRFEHILTRWHNQGFNDILAIHQDKNRKIWFGADQNKIGCYDKTSRELITYEINHPIKNIEVRAIFEDVDGNFWLGTVGSGLVFFHTRGKSFKAYTQNDGLTSNTVLGILLDERNQFWLSTVNGLARFNPQTGEVKNYYKENGLQSNQFNYNAYLKTRDGEMFFGGINGVTAFYPAKIQENTYIPPVYITDFKILNRPVEIGGENPILARDISVTDEIELSYKHAVFSFEFVALNYAISSQNQYAYQLVGFDEDWNYIGNRRFVSYTNLDAGEYTFKVKAANNDGFWNEKGAQIKISISPPFWRTLWFKILIIALLILIIKHFFDDLRQKKNLSEATALANEAQLKLLRNQMNPH